MLVGKLLNRSREPGIPLRPVFLLQKRVGCFYHGIRSLSLGDAAEVVNNSPGRISFDKVM
jgi:hypothetical protein